MSSSENIKSKTISDIIKKWFLNSPSNGIRRIGRAKTFISGLFCGYIFWVFTVLMLCFINIVIINYIAHPTKIHLTLTQYKNPDHFPAITFCNINPLKHDGLLDDVRKSRLPGAESSSSSSSSNESEYRKVVSAYMERILAAQVNGERHPFVKWGFRLNELLITCIFNRKICDRNLTQMFHPNYGNCYTFDNNDHVQKEEINHIRHDWSIHDDNGYKLFLELFLHQGEYNEYLGHRAAFRIFIHRKHEIPILSQNSILLGPNKYTKLSFLPRVMSFSQQCRNDLTNYMKQIFLTQRVRYTQALCCKLCEHRFIVKKCHCIEPTLAVFYQYFNNNQTTANIGLCAFDNACLRSRGYFNATELCPECLPECVNIQYSVQSSHAYYPNVNAYEKILRRVRNHFRLDGQVNAYLNTLGGSSSNHRTRLHDNIVAVEISSSPYATETLTESSMYTWVDVISSIGGQTGLWIGISLISFVEIMELLYLLLNRFCSYIFFCKKEIKENK